MKTEDDSDGQVPVLSLLIQFAGCNRGMVVEALYPEVCPCRLVERSRALASHLSCGTYKNSLTTTSLLRVSHFSSSRRQPCVSPAAMNGDIDILWVSY